MTPATYVFLAPPIALAAVVGLFLICRRAARRLRARDLADRARK